MAKLAVGPLLRFVSDTEAVLWVETDDPCEVEILGHRERTFCVAGHHYGIVVVDDLEPGTDTEYEVALDGVRRWPERDSELPPSTIRTLGRDGPIRIAFGSCRVSLPHHTPFTLPKDEHDEAREFDALFSLVQEMRRSPPELWPLVLLMLGDQVYADEVSPETLAFIRKRRDIRKPPGTEVADFEEYTRLYREAWSDPAIRWLFSTVSCAMVVDDHDINDDWNISQAWVEEMAERQWWPTRERAGLAAYWLYQFIGNLSPELLRESELLGQLREADDGWDELEHHLEGDYDHILIGTSDPFLLAPGLHYLERWGERVCAGAWGDSFAERGERLRQALDFDHWAAFGDSFTRLARLLEKCAAGRFGRAPASITVLSGDVHHAYLAEVGFRRNAGVKSRVWQAVCSPFRNALDKRERRMVELGDKAAPTAAARALARGAGVRAEPIRWRLVEGPFYDNQVGTIRLDGRRAEARLERTVGDPESDHRELHTSFERRLA